MPAPTLSIPDLPGQFARLMPDGQLRLRSEALGIPLREIPGVRRRIFPHRALGWRRANHAGLAAEGRNRRCGGSGSCRQPLAPEVIVHLSKRAHNPLLKEGGLIEPTQPVAWLGGRVVHLVCP